MPVRAGHRRPLPPPGGLPRRVQPAPLVRHRSAFAFRHHRPVSRGLASSSRSLGNTVALLAQHMNMWHGLEMQASSRPPLSLVILGRRRLSGH